MKIEKYLKASPFFTIHRAYELTTKDIRKWLKEDRLNFLEALVLLALFFEQGKDVLPSTLANTFQTSRGNISHCISKLEKLGLAKRNLNPSDARSYKIHLTAKGKTKALSLISKFDELQLQLENQLGEDKVSQINQGILQITSKLNEFSV